MALLAIAIILLCLLMPWIGLPLGLIAATVAILLAWLSGLGPFASSSASSTDDENEDEDDEDEGDEDEGDEDEDDET